MTLLPRVLIVAPIKFNQTTGSGVTMGNLFRGWPLDRLAQVHSDGDNEPDLSVCTRYFHLPNEIFWQASLGKTAVSLLTDTTSYHLGRREQLLGHWLNPERLLAWCRDFAPDLIYARPHDRPSFYNWLPPFLSQALGVPYVTRVLDDWPTRYEKSPSRAKRLFWQALPKRDLQRAFDGAAANLAISQEMADAFAERYKRPFTYFHNCIDASAWDDVPKRYERGDIFNLVYIGTVVEDKELHSLIDLRHVLRELSAAGHRVRLTIYGPDTYRPTVKQHLVEDGLVVHGGLFPMAEKAAVLSGADLLVLPINFDNQSQAYVGYSFQTKVPEYMASGTPTLVYGPPSSPNVRYAQQDKWAAVVAERDLAKLRQQVTDLIESQTLRYTLGQRARQLAFTQHDGTAVRARFRALLAILPRKEYRRRVEGLEQ
ncbi:MAG: glycosyltransferase [Chloroflexota bacterium]